MPRYITVGALTTVWSAIWYSCLRNQPPTGGLSGYICMGFLLTGVILPAIGFAVGPMARWSRQAELPPSEVPTAAPAAPRRNVGPRRV